MPNARFRSISKPSHSSTQRPNRSPGRAVRCSIALPLALSAALLLTVGCSDDDPTEPESEPALWTHEMLPSGLSATVLYDVDAQGTYVVAVGSRFVAGEFTPAAIERTAQGWEVLELPELPAQSILTGVALTESGVPILVGVCLDAREMNQPLIVDFRTDPSLITPELERDAALNSVAVGGETVFTIGFGHGGFAMKSVDGGPWVEEPVPAGSRAEHGMHDLEYLSGRFLACGFDDGGPPYAVVLGYENGTWSTWGVPGRNVEPKCVLGLPGGGFFTGGRTLDDSSEDDLSMLQSYTPDTEEWTAIVLPSSQRLGSVEDIHRSEDGTLTTVLGGPTAAIVRDGETEYEFPGGLHGVAEDENGTLYVVGFEGAENESPRPLVAVRRR